MLQFSLIAFEPWHYIEIESWHYMLQFSLFENRRPSVGVAAFGNFKKSLTNSFENFMAKVPVSKACECFVLWVTVLCIYHLFTSYVIIFNNLCVYKQQFCGLFFLKTTTVLWFLFMFCTYSVWFINSYSFNLRCSVRFH